MTQRGETHARTEIRFLVSLAVPMIATNVGYYTMAVVDGIVAGTLGELHMGALVLGATVLSVPTAFGVGLMIGAEPLMSQAHGAAERDLAKHWLSQATWLGAASGVALVGCLVLIAPHIPAASDATKDAFLDYVFSRLPGLPFHIVFAAQSAYLSCIGRPRLVLVVVLVANAVNLVADVLFAKVLDMAVVGIGLSSSACYVFMFGASLWLVAQAPGRPLLSRPRAHRIAECARLGVPVACQISLEAAILVLYALLAAQIGETELAAHQIASAVAGFSFFGGLGFSAATSVRVGTHVGASHPGKARVAARIGILGATIAIGIGSALIFVSPETPATLLAQAAPESARVGAFLLRIACGAMVFEAAQLALAGALRGLGDTRWALGATFVGQLAIGVPLSVVAAFGLDLGVGGVWVGTATGFAIGVLILGLRIRYQFDRGVQRL